MKKLISLIFVLVFLITICGCKKTIDNGSSLSVDSIIIEEETYVRRKEEIKKTALSFFLRKFHKLFCHFKKKY